MTGSLLMVFISGILAMESPITVLAFILIVVVGVRCVSVHVLIVTIKHAEPTITGTAGCWQIFVSSGIVVCRAKYAR